MINFQYDVIDVVIFIKFIGFLGKGNLPCWYFMIITTPQTGNHILPTLPYRAKIIKP
jgi:hypothetical protein